MNSTRMAPLLLALLLAAPIAAERFCLDGFGKVEKNIAAEEWKDAEKALAGLAAKRLHRLPKPLCREPFAAQWLALRSVVLEALGQPYPALWHYRAAEALGLTLPGSKAPEIPTANNGRQGAPDTTVERTMGLSHIQSTALRSGLYGPVELIAIYVDGQLARIEISQSPDPMLTLASVDVFSRIPRPATTAEESNPFRQDWPRSRPRP